MLQTLSYIGRHPLTRDRPLAGFVRFVRWQIESRLRAEVEFSWIDESKLVVRNGMTGATGRIYCGLREFPDMAFVLHLLRPSDLLVDVGANIGSYTVLASPFVGAATIAIEPDPGTMAAPRLNIALNNLAGRMEAVETAIGAAAGVASFTVGLDTTNQVMADQNAPTRKVPVETLDAILIGRDPEVVRPLLDAGFERVYYDPFSRELLPQAILTHSNALFVRNRPACERRLKAARRRTVYGRRF